MTTPNKPETIAPMCDCTHSEEVHWPESKDAFKLRRCSILGCDCQHFIPVGPSAPRFKHFCKEWDFLEIDETYPEFEACLCYPKAEDSQLSDEDDTPYMCRSEFRCSYQCGDCEIAEYKSKLPKAAEPTPTIAEYIETEWQEGDGLPGPAYRRKYGIEPHSNDPTAELAPVVDSKRNAPQPTMKCPSVQSNNAPYHDWYPHTPLRENTECLACGVKANELMRGLEAEAPQPTTISNTEGERVRVATSEGWTTEPVVPLSAFHKLQDIVTGKRGVDIMLINILRHWDEGKIVKLRDALIDRAPKPAPVEAPQAEVAQVYVRSESPIYAKVIKPLQAELSTLRDRNRLLEGARAIISRNTFENDSLDTYKDGWNEAIRWVSALLTPTEEPK